MQTIHGKSAYYETALVVLAESGFKSLSIGRMTKTLGVTPGSFYHHFGNWPGFVEALLSYWSHREEERLRSLAFQDATPIDGLDLLRQLTLDLNHPAEAAIRAWGMNDAAVQEVQRTVDEVRRRTVEKTIERIIQDPEAARRISALGLATLVGYQLLSAHGTHAELDELLSVWRELIALHSAEPIP